MCSLILSHILSLALLIDLFSSTKLDDLSNSTVTFAKNISLSSTPQTDHLNLTLNSPRKNDIKVNGQNNSQSRSEKSITLSGLMKFTEVNISNEAEFYGNVSRWHEEYCESTCGHPSTYRRCPYPRAYICEACYCDEKCHMYGDCCPGVYISSEVRSSDEQLQCRKIHPKRNAANEIEKYFMKTKCPVGYNDEQNQFMCQANQSDLFSVLNGPVTSLDDMMTYKNEYCAKCHGQVNFVKWSMRYQCEEHTNIYFTETLTEAIQEMIDDKGCVLYFEIPANETLRPRQCHEPGMSVCPTADGNEDYSVFLAKACEAYTAVYHAGNKVYRNVFCYICDGNALPPHLNRCFFRGGVFPLSALLDFNRLETAPSLRKQEETTLACKEGFIIDGIKVNELVSCPVMTCVDILESINI